MSKVKGERKISDLVRVYSKLPGENEKSDVAVLIETLQLKQRQHRAVTWASVAGFPLAKSILDKSCSDRKAITREVCFKSHANQSERICDRNSGYPEQSYLATLGFVIARTTETVDSKKFRNSRYNSMAPNHVKTWLRRFKGFQKKKNPVIINRKTLGKRYISNSTERLYIKWTKPR